MKEVVKKQALVISQKNQVWVEISLQIWGRAFYHIFFQAISEQNYIVSQREKMIKVSQKMLIIECVFYVPFQGS